MYDFLDLCVSVVSFFIEVNPYENLLDAVKVWELDENEKVQLVYVFQNRNYKKATREFLDVSSEYAQVRHMAHALYLPLWKFARNLS